MLAIGSLSALIGILYATIQSDMKRLLAHSTIENMGIVAAGIGAAMIFSATDHRVIAAIALIAALYHLVNHAVYKALLFVGTGAVEAGAGTRDLDRLGGIVRACRGPAPSSWSACCRSPRLPPLNGFVSEWLTLQTLLRAALLSVDGDQDHLRGLRRAHRADGRPGRHLLRQGLCHGVPRHVALRRARRSAIEVRLGTRRRWPARGVLRLPRRCCRPM